MSSLLRTIKHRRWLQKEAGDLQAAALKDIGTKNSNLSVYSANSNVGKNRMVAALAATKRKVAQVDYVLVDVKWLEDHGFDLTKTPDSGQTPDPYVNKLHYDIQGLTVYKLYELALHVSTLIRAEGPIVRPVIAELIDRSISSGHIEESKLNESLLKDLRRLRMRRK